MRAWVVLLILAGCGRLDFDRVSSPQGILDAAEPDTSPPAVCGDNMIDANDGETCDDGNTLSGDGCNATCQSNEACGNSIVDATETCDHGGVATATCDRDCTLPTCGDGVRNTTAAEQCDDANSINTDACLATCKNAFCGDGFTRAGFEECDDANGVDDDACTNGCKANSG